MKEPKCDRCGKLFDTFTECELPKGVGFQQEDGTQINLCRDCIMELGKIKQSGNEVLLNKFFKEIGV